MPVQLSRRLLSVEDYHRMVDAGILTTEDKVELLNGEIIEMSPIGSDHAYVVDRLNMLMGQLYAGKGFIRVQSPLQLDDHSEPEPDLMVLKNPIEKYAESHPQGTDVILLIEVSSSTLEKDREVKLPLYAAAKVPVVWIVNLLKSEIEQYQQPHQDQYLLRKLCPLDSMLELPDLESTIAVKNVFGR